ncbi:MAG TPA: TonB-dependent receptor [Allosphingosinicella sp.]|nr:TonB-dependent receptor [Allosphingosinicella sp.]
MPLTLPLLAAASLAAEPSIIVTGSREAMTADSTALSSTLIEEETIEALALPSAVDLLRLTPGVAVATTGPRGTQTQLRIRGAEANHSLLFVDGIRFNDPAAGNEPRFELLTADLLSRIEIVRGPQSALWGAEALGGVIAVAGPDPLAASGLAAVGEYGSLDSRRAFGRYGSSSATFGMVAGAGWQRSDGVDSFGAQGERDGYENLAASLKAVHRAGAVEAGAVAHWIEGRSEFDGFDPVTFRRADTLDRTSNRIGAVRGWASARRGGWTVRAEASYLDSANRNFLGRAPLNSSFGDRLSVGGQVSRRSGGHLFVLAAEHQQEDFRARDTAFFGGTDQDRSRSLTAAIGEWRAEWTADLITDLAVRHDDFSAFDDATTLRASVLVRPARAWTIHAGYGEGIAQPTFYDLFGFFPGSFVGNPELRPERSRGWEAGVAWRDEGFEAGATYFSARLEDEIVDIFTLPSTTANASGRSRRQGLELRAGYRRADRLVLSANYTYLAANDQRTAGEAPVRETRRPRHSANLVAHGTVGRFRWGAALAYVGARRDSDFDAFRTVTLAGYVLASAQAAYRVLPKLEAFVRVENAFSADYQDVVGYDTLGRTVHAGLRVALGD